MSVHDLVGERLPDRAKPAAESLAHLLVPGMSLRKLRESRATRARFVERFFESEAEFEGYEAEFFGGRIVEICRSASDRVPAGASIYDAHMDECVRLYALVRKYRPNTIVETGVYNGVSTASMLLALDENDSGELHSLDASPLLAARGERTQNGGMPAERVSYYERGRPSCAEAGTQRLPVDREPGWIIPADLRDRWTLTVGRSQRELPGLLASLDPVELFVHDSEHAASAMAFEVELAWEHLVPGGMAVSFHVDRNRVFETFAAERRCERGRLTYTYNGFEDYDSHCCSGYLLKRPGRRFETGETGTAERPEDRAKEGIRHASAGETS